MRLPKLFLTAAACGLAAAAAAQDSETPGEAQAEPAEARPSTGLSDLEQTVRDLQDEAQPEPSGEPAAPEPPQTEAEPAQPEAEPAQPEAQPAQPEATPAPPLTRAQIAELERTVERGRQLFAIARAGIIATQDMLSRVSDPEGAGISGWVAEPEGNAMAVTFYGAADAGPRAVYRARVLGGRVTSREVFLGAERPALVGAQARMAAARAASESEDHRACSTQPFNVLVVPPATPDTAVDVYRMTPATARGRFPLGGHFRSTVAPDGTVSASRGFTNACVEFEAPEVAAGEQPRPVAVTHLLDPMPTELHVFLSLWSGRPLVVATGEPQRLWLVTGERIAEIRQ